jgi:hypothetical protein
VKSIVRGHWANMFPTQVVPERGEPVTNTVRRGADASEFAGEPSSDIMAKGLLSDLSI